MARPQYDIDQIIQELIEWNARYPKAVVTPSASSNGESVLMEYANTEEEYKQLLEKYEIMQRYYRYLFVKNGRGLLTTEQKQMCKEGNIRGIFRISNKNRRIV